MFYLFPVTLNVSEPNPKSKREYISAYKRKKKRQKNGTEGLTCNTLIACSIVDWTKA